MPKRVPGWQMFAHMTEEFAGYRCCSTATGRALDFPVKARAMRLVATPGIDAGATLTVPSRAEIAVATWVASSWASAQRSWGWSGSGRRRARGRGRRGRKTAPIRTASSRRGWKGGGETVEENDGVGDRGVGLNVVDPGEDTVCSGNWWDRWRRPQRGCRCSTCFESPLTRARCEDSLGQRSHILCATGTLWDRDTRVTIKYRTKSYLSSL